MRKTVAVLALTTALIGVPAAASFADTPAAAGPVAQTTDNTNQHSDKSGLWGLLGLLGLAGLVKRRETADATSTRR